MNMPPSGITSRMLRSTLILAVALAAGCPAAAPEDAPGAYRAFYGAASAGDWQAARVWLDDDSKQALQRAVQTLARRSRRPQDARREMLERLRFQVTGPLRAVEVIRRRQGRVLLRVQAGTCRQQQDDCVQSEVEMVNTAKGWRVHAVVPAELAPRQSGG